MKNINLTSTKNLQICGKNEMPNDGFSDSLKGTMQNRSKFDIRKKKCNTKISSNASINKKKLQQ